MVDETTSWKTPFGEQRDARNAHLDALPGKTYRDWFEALNRASRVYGGNAAELDRHVQRFVGTPTFVHELPDDFGFETAGCDRSSTPPPPRDPVQAGQHDVNLDAVCSR